MSAAVEAHTAGARRPSRTSSIKGRRGSGVEKLDSHVVAWHTSTHKHEEKPAAEEEILDRLLKKYQAEFTVSADKLKEIVKNFVGVLEKGLEKPGQTVPMLPAYVFGWPTGAEEGSYLALDLGGTNLRVCHVNLKGQGKFEVTQTKFKLTDEQKQEEGQKLFDFCASCLNTFIQDHFGGGEFGDGALLEEDIPLGFTFSYPMEQDRIDHGKLVRWTKGFGNPNTEGRDCAAMFRQALEEQHVPIKMTSIINDTTGTLIASNYVNADTRIACIFGTGCNAAYMERIKNIPKIAQLKLPEDEEMAINCEYGAFDSFDSKYLPRTKYDVTIDETSNKPKEQVFEKMIAGLYLGEIFRLCLIEMVDDGDLFLGQNTYKIEKPYVFDTAFLSLMESDPTDELLTITGLFTHFFGLETTIPERKFFRELAKLIGTRAARLSSCGIAALVTKMGLVEQGCGVGADGSLFSKYPKFPDRLHQALVDIFGEENGKKIQVRQAEDGSGVGSAIIAAMTKARKEEGKYEHV